MATNFTTDECQDGLELLFSDQLELNFTDALASCQEQGGILVVPSHSAKYDRLRNLIGNNGGIRPFLGLLDPTNPQFKTFATDRFLTVPDGKPNPFSSGEPQIAPWDTNNPNDNFQRQDCVDLIRNNLNDEECQLAKPFICERTCGDQPQVTFSACEAGETQYFINQNASNLDGAINGCRRIEGDSSLAIPLNETEFESMVSFLQTEEVPIALIGLVDFLDVGGVNTTRFQGLAAERSPFFSEANGVPPWAPNQPDDELEDENCVVINEDGLLEDVNCSALRVSLCQRPCIVDVDIDDVDVDVQVEEAELLSTFAFSAVALMIVGSFSWLWLLLVMYKRKLKEVEAALQLEDYIVFQTGTYH